MVRCPVLSFFSVKTVITYRADANKERNTKSTAFITLSYLSFDNNVDVSRYRSSVRLIFSS